MALENIDFIVARYQSTDGNCANGGCTKEAVSSEVVSPCTVITTLICSIHSLSACTFRAACAQGLCCLSPFRERGMD